MRAAHVKRSDDEPLDVGVRRAGDEDDERRGSEQS
jgi:hypothetical protein